MTSLLACCKVLKKTRRPIRRSISIQKTNRCYTFSAWNRSIRSRRSWSVRSISVLTKQANNFWQICSR